MEDDREVLTEFALYDNGRECSGPYAEERHEIFFEGLTEAEARIHTFALRNLLKRFVNRFFGPHRSKCLHCGVMPTDGELFRSCTANGLVQPFPTVRPYVRKCSASTGQCEYSNENAEGTCEK